MGCCQLPELDLLVPDLLLEPAAEVVAAEEEAGNAVAEQAGIAVEEEAGNAVAEQAGNAVEEEAGNAVEEEADSNVEEEAGSRHGHVSCNFCNL